MKEVIVNAICERLVDEFHSLSAQFKGSASEVGGRYAVVDDLLPASLAHRTHATFPRADQVRLMNSFRERKYTSKCFDQFDPLLADTMFAIQSRWVIKVIERIAGIARQVPDPALYAGGLSAMGRSQIPGPHIDNSHARDRSRLALMETNLWPCHSVSEVRVDRLCCCLSNYYFSPQSPMRQGYFNITAFKARPEQKFRRVIAWVNGRVRQALRRVVRRELERKDIYDGPPR